MKQTFTKIIKIGAVASFMLFSLLLAVPAHVKADIPAGCPGGPAGPLAPGVTCPNASASVDVTKQPDVSNDDSFGDCSGGDVANCSFMEKIVNPLIRFLSAGVGFIIITMVVIAGIQYSAAGSDPQKVAAAKKRISNAMIALITYILLLAALQWLMPGGIV